MQVGWVLKSRGMRAFILPVRWWSYLSKLEIVMSGGAFWYKGLKSPVFLFWERPCVTSWEGRRLRPHFLFSTYASCTFISSSQYISVCFLDSFGIRYSQPRVYRKIDTFYWCWHENISLWLCWVIRCAAPGINIKSTVQAIFCLWILIFSNYLVNSIHRY